MNDVGFGIVVRHGATQWNLEHRIIGQCDPPLASEGVQQARALAARLKDIHFRTVLTSPLSRARETAAIVAAWRNVDIVSRVELLEASFGSLEGKLMDDAVVLPMWLAREQNKYRFVPPGGEDYVAVEERVAAFIDGLDVRSTPLIVTHVGVIRTLARRYGGLTEEAAGELSADHGDVWRLRLGPRVEFALVTAQESSIPDPGPTA